MAKETLLLQSLCTNISIFTTITSDEQYFLNEKAVVRSYEKSVI